MAMGPTVRQLYTPTGPQVSFLAQVSYAGIFLCLLFSSWVPASALAPPPGKRQGTENRHGSQQMYPLRTGQVGADPLILKSLNKQTI